MRKLGLSLVVASSVAFAGGVIDPKPVIPVVPPVEVEKSDIVISANMTMASKYIWRGVDQNNKGVAIQGGIDLEYKGFYLGTWASNVDYGVGSTDNIELDVYGGYRGEISGIGFDIGYIAYFLPNTYVDLDSTAKEAYLGLSKDIGDFNIGTTLSYDFDAINEDGDDGSYNIQFDASVKTIYDITLSSNFGISDRVSTDDYYFLVGANKTVGKFDLGIAYTGYYSDALDDTTSHVVATISTSF